MTDRITIRLGPLVRPLAAFAKKNKLDLSAAVRRILSDSLGVEEPNLKPGVGSLGEEELTRHQKAAAQSRWSKGE